MGMRLRRIQTTTKKVDGKDVVVPVLDGDGKEIELWSIDVPSEIEHLGIPKEVEAQGKDAIEDYIATEMEKLHPSPTPAEGEE